MTDVKICGIKEIRHLHVAAASGARFAGFVFFPRSPRHLSREIAEPITRAAPPTLTKIGLFVDPGDDLLSETLGFAALDMLQLHGSETPQRVAAIKSKFAKPIIKALKIAGPEDLVGLPLYEEVADWILFDAKAPEGAVLPGGNGAVFDWTILKNITLRKPWMLSGGLTPENVPAALSVLQPDAIDVSSGVEDAPGVKSTDKIKAFIQAVKQA